MSVDGKEALNIVAGVFAWQRLIILDITVAGAGAGSWGRGRGVDAPTENIDDPQSQEYIKPKIKVSEEESLVSTWKLKDKNT